MVLTQGSHNRMRQSKDTSITLQHYNSGQAYSIPIQSSLSHSLGDESVIEDRLVPGTELISGDPGAAPQSAVHVSLPQSPLVFARGGGAFNIVCGTAWCQVSTETEITTTGNYYVTLFVLWAAHVFT